MSPFARFVLVAGFISAILSVRYLTIVLVDNIGIAAGVAVLAGLFFAAWRMDVSDARREREWLLEQRWQARKGPLSS